ncbi:uncharacterized protein N7484_007077 [Penicillium longicatenatum]|uniref:uncharacterized protein n=1 Tax=Penicillium longicatenatum TaxID=1561947 RepID=UPI0025466667|nr:uncharacterized protein N7484_007077 [Penicillium longicatenatum]KAJ5639215.1 hypothetical protein N7484_007077 [Penicillium longicatenatum]
MDSLPTPYQLGLTIKYLDGSALGSIWSWIVYLVSWRKTRQPQTPVLVTTSSIAILATALGLLVTAADTWLHFVTTTVPFTQVSPVADQMGYSFGLIPECLSTNNSAVAQNEAQILCSIQFGQGSYLRNIATTLQMISNASSDATVYTHTDLNGKPYAYFGVPSDNLAAEHDFTAHTYGGDLNPNFLRSLHGGIAFVLGCKSTVYDVEYDRVNGSITRFDTRPSNTSVSNIWQATISNYGTDWTLPVKQAMTDALFMTNTSRAFADMIALSFSKASMAMGTQGIEPRLALALQRQITTLVASIPMAPLIAFVVVSLLFVVTSMLLTVLAIWASKLEQVRYIQASLGTVGLVADRFENNSLKRDAASVEGFFAEYVSKTSRRVAIETDKESGYIYTQPGKTQMYRILAVIFSADSLTRLGA